MRRINYFLLALLLTLSAGIATAANLSYVDPRGNFVFDDAGTTIVCPPSSIEVLEGGLLDCYNATIGIEASCIKVRDYQGYIQCGTET